MIAVAHLSDIHLDDGERGAERARRVMAYIDNLPKPIDAVVVWVHERRTSVQGRATRVRERATHLQGRATR
jgi:hypothetical protein